jgi:hypothetical protein
MRTIGADLRKRRALNHAKRAADVRQDAPGRKAMTNFNTDTLSALRDVPEVLIRTERHPRSALVIWVVVADDQVFVRSWRGTKARLYGHLAAGGPATLEFAGCRLASVRP